MNLKTVGLTPVSRIYRIYSNGESELEMGRAFKKLDVDRSQLVVS